MRINLNNNPKDYQEEFEKSGAATIRDFLTPEYAEELRKFFEEDMPADWWYSSTYPDETGNISNVRAFSENYQTIKNNVEAVNHAFYEQGRGGVAGTISYNFYRTLGNHSDTCYCHECEFRRWLLSDELLSFLHNVSGDTYTGFNTTFASKYSEGCFLSPHTDYANGDIGFVLQLTKQWKPQWGGLLHFMDDRGRTIEQTEVPTFNSLTLFRIIENQGRWHYVSHVNPGVKANRLAYTGWFTKEK